MESLFLCLNAILPIFLTISAGFGARKLGWVREEDVPRMNAVAFKVFMPLMCFSNIYSSELSQAVSPRLLLFAVGAVLSSYALSWGLGERLGEGRPQKGVIIQGLYRSNYLILGLPFVAGLAGTAGLGTASVMGAVVVPLFNVLAVITLEAYRGQQPQPKKLLLGILKNPLILGSAAGVLALLLELRLPPFLEIFTRDMGRVASPLMLFLLGAFFRPEKLRSHSRTLAAVCAGRLLLFPALVLCAAAALGFRGAEFVALIAMSGSSTAAASFTMAQQMEGDAALAGDIVVSTSALCSLTLFFWSFLFRQLGFY